MKKVGAYTAATGVGYPPYANITIDGDEVTITVREAPKIREGCYVCGYAADRGQPGRCTPGDANCNNYCNMAPEKGPMQDHPLPCTHIDCGQTVQMTMPKAEFDAMLECLK
jgi:hypothetical protein